MSEYDYDEIVAASEIEVDEIIEGDSQKSAEHDELWSKSVNKSKTNKFVFPQKSFFVVADRKKSASLRKWKLASYEKKTSRFFDVLRCALRNEFLVSAFLVLRVEMKCPWAELV